MNTWRMHEWLGCGPSAASQYGGERYQRPANLDVWCAAIESGQPPKTGTVLLSDDLLLTDAVIFGLRMNRGIAMDALAGRFSKAKNVSDLKRRLAQFVEEGLACSDGERYYLSHRGRLLCDAIGSAILEDQS
jgi:oxygen-independent coproporphyrinogen-3 oxidase